MSQLTPGHFFWLSNQIKDYNKQFILLSKNLIKIKIDISREVSVGQVDKSIDTCEKMFCFVRTKNL